LAYWPENQPDFYTSNETSRENELARYDLVIHLKVARRQDYNSDHSDIRIESFEQAEAIDKKIIAAWEGHPNQVVIDNGESFTQKINRVHKLVRENLEESSS